MCQSVKGVLGSCHLLKRKGKEFRKTIKVDFLMKKLNS